MTNYVMIGNSAAAVGCIEGIRQIDREGARSPSSAGSPTTPSPGR